MLVTMLLKVNIDNNKGLPQKALLLNYARRCAMKQDVYIEKVSIKFYYKLFFVTKITIKLRRNC